MLPTNLFKLHILTIASALFRKEVGFEVGSDSKVGFLFPTYIFLHIGHCMSVNDAGIKREVRAKLNISVQKSKKWSRILNFKDRKILKSYS